MGFIDQLRRLDRLDALIRRRSTGNAQQLSQKMEVSERTVYNLLRLLRNLGADIEYCQEKNSYYYEKEPIIWYNSKKIKIAKALQCFCSIYFKL